MPGMNKFLPLLLALAPLCCALASSSDCVLLTDAQMQQRGAHLGDLLRSKSFEALEDEFAQRLGKIERGEESDELLRLELHAAFGKNSAYEPLLSEWIKLYPDSYVARVARAAYYIDSGYEKRGHAFASATSQEQFMAMEEEFQKAGADLESAKELMANPAVVYSELLIIARTANSGIDVSQLADYALQKFPQSLAIRVNAARALTPKWAGSIEKLDDLVSSVNPESMAPAYVATFRYRVEIEKAEYYEIFTKQLEKASQHYLAAGEACNTFLAWDGAIRTGYDAEKWETVIKASGQLLSLSPAHQRTFSRRGWAHEKTGKWDLALKDYKIAAGLGDAWAQNKVGWILWQGINNTPRDFRKARKLFEQAAAQGNQTAVTNLRALNAELSAGAK